MSLLDLENDMNSSIYTPAAGYILSKWAYKEYVLTLRIGNIGPNAIWQCGSEEGP